ncbi:hypothetical protein D0C36_20000 [Mucilaginibacter conchicola]|uniref:PD(D/E)XK endonuclease domain-containing protein n=1 Tax=Mucilaginibacter conchicola TaxID=2303333 RepID=A0A372NQL2_9SPHI|nr:hypothetical protein [Mucilaginibacter conchicola]RFZ91221.1 hypothetical protein D0C36_20000 [Mucilaginibacter conchicola]
MSVKLEKNQTGIAGEFYVAGELSRFGYNVTITFGNTKSVDLLIQKDNVVFAIQVKAIQATKSICWNIDKTKVFPNHYYVLVNLHVDHPERKPEFFVLTGNEVISLFKDTPKAGGKRAYLDYKHLLGLSVYKDRWEIFGRPSEII